VRVIFLSMAFWSRGWREGELNGAVSGPSEWE
jgi:hypothetical protein